MRGATRVAAALTAAAHTQDAAPHGYSHAPAAGGAQAAAGAWHDAEAYAQTPAQSAAAEFVERSDPPKIRVVVRKRPLNQKARRPPRRPCTSEDCNEKRCTFTCVPAMHRAVSPVTAAGRRRGGVQAEGGVPRGSGGELARPLGISTNRRPLTDGHAGERQEVERGEEDAVEVDMGEARLVVNEPRAKVRPRRAGSGAAPGGDRLLLQPSLPAQARLSASPGARHGPPGDVRLLACGSSQLPGAPA